MNFSDCFTRDDSGVLIPECPLECWTGCKDTLLKLARPPPPPPRIEPVDTGISPQAAAQDLYTPIPVNSWQTRLLRICNDPGPGSSMCCRLLVADVIYYDGMVVNEEGNDKDVSYIALSYEWGSPEYPRVVQVNGISFPITENLFQALRALRSAMGDVYLWADALCINQYNEAEKSIQVRRMQTIYRKASKVVAWNPQWDEDMHSIFTKALNMETRHQNTPGKENHRFVSNSDFQDEEVQDGSEQHSTRCLELAYRILATASNPPLFRRIWVRQEIHNARILHCQYQHVEFPLETARKKAEYLLQFQTEFSREIIPTLLISTGPKSQYANWELSSKNETDPFLPRPMTLMKALRTNHLFQATDPRDYVYGVLGLTSVRTTASKSDSTVRSAVLNVDYSQTMSQVFQSAVVYFIRAYGDLGVLSLVDRKNRDINRKLPSWTPDWTSLQAFNADTRWNNMAATIGDDTWRNSLMDILASNQHPKPRSSSQNTSWQPDPQCDLDGILSLPGIRLGYIQGSEKTSAYQDFEVRLETDDKDSQALLPVLNDSVSTLIHSVEEMPAAEGMDFRQATLSADGEKFVAVLREVGLLRGLIDEYGLVLFPSRAYVPQEAIEGDEIILLQGSDSPFLVRRHDDGVYEILGAMGNFPLCSIKPFSRGCYWWSWDDFKDMIEDPFIHGSGWSRMVQQQFHKVLSTKLQFKVFRFK
ncbi:hypothetical protein G7054_g14112 [Neopestalotiopsis clavispora]|nr:hypothetical protein G7054_g14112 [Neopestalotiopsis clavispora]